MNLKRISILAFVLLVLILSTQAYAFDRIIPFLGFNGGFETLTESKDNYILKDKGNVVGASFKLFPDQFGVGISFFQGVHGVNKAVLAAGEKVEKKFIGGYNLDFMMRARNIPKWVVGYMLLSVGSARERISILSEDGNNDELTSSTATYGFGVGAFTMPSMEAHGEGFSIGAEARYIMLPKFDEASGMGQFYLTLGYVF